MDQQVLKLVIAEAKTMNLKVDGSTELRLDEYLKRHFRHDEARNKVIIQTYLSNAALRIALTDKKGILDGEDIKAAIWLFHQPTGIDDECVEAGQFALHQEQKRKERASGRIVIGGTAYRGILSERFAQHLDAQGGGSALGGFAR